MQQVECETGKTTEGHRNQKRYLNLDL